jgi:DNA polymerase III epsilon subunit-like protein
MILAILTIGLIIGLIIYIFKPGKTTRTYIDNSNSVVNTNYGQTYKAANMTSSVSGSSYNEQSSKTSGEYLIFFDTETTGLPNDYNAPATATGNWPRLVQLGWILTDSKYNVITKRNLIIKPEGFVIPSSSSDVHGITTRMAMENGVSLSSALQLFSEDLKKATRCIGHNVSFDKKVVACELYRKGMPDLLSRKPSTCTMRTTTDLCRIPGRYGYKYPKLQELHEHLFGYEFSDAHDAMSDITATLKCYKELKRRNLI